jgi:hypothetical protein
MGSAFTRSRLVDSHKRALGRANGAARIKILAAHQAANLMTTRRGHAIDGTVKADNA